MTEISGAQKEARTSQITFPMTFYAQVAASSMLYTFLDGMSAMNPRSSQFLFEQDDSRLSWDRFSKLEAEISKSLTTLWMCEPESHAAVFESQIKEGSYLHQTILTDANALKTSKDLEIHLKAWPCPAFTVEPFV